MGDAVRVGMRVVRIRFESFCWFELRMIIVMIVSKAPRAVAGPFGGVSQCHPAETAPPRGKKET